MDLNQANRNIKIAWIFSGIAIPVSFVFFGIGINHFPHYPRNIIIPFCSDLGLFVGPIALVLVFMVYRKSRLGAILLFTVHVLERLFSYAYIPVTSSWVYILTWICVSVLSPFILFRGIRGTFAYHQLVEKQ